MKLIIKEKIVPLFKNQENEEKLAFLGKFGKLALAFLFKN